MRTNGAFETVRADATKLKQVLMNLISNAGKFTRNGEIILSLRNLEDGSFRPVGASAERPADVRILAATNADLRERIEAGRFRKDLYFRITGYDIELRPLRERRQDVELFIAHFLRGFAGELKVAAPALSPEAQKALLDYEYPGNKQNDVLPLLRGPDVFQGRRTSSNNERSGVRRQIQPRTRRIARTPQS